MKKFFLTLILILAVGGVLYALGVGPFNKNKGDAAKGTQGDQRGRRNRSIAVEVAVVKVGDVAELLSYVGSLLPNASVTVAPKIAGRLEKVRVDVGDWVKERQVLAILEKDELTEEFNEAKASLKIFEATLKGKEAELKDLRRKLDRAKILLERTLIAREEVDTLETQVLSAAAQVELTNAQLTQMKARLINAQIRLDSADVLSPFAGYVGKRFVDRGALVNSNTPLVTIVDISSVKVIVAAVENDYRKISPGQTAAVSADAYPGQRFQGTVARVAPVLDPDTRTAEVEIELPNPQGALKPGMFARVEIVAQRRPGVLLVPRGAQVKTQDGYAVFKIQEGGDRVTLVSVQPGLGQDGWVEIAGELKEGDQIVTIGSNLLRDGQRVSIIDGSGAVAPSEKKGNRGKKRGGKKRRPSNGERS